eukprot:1404516-Rhodomonas_salina.1
MVPVYPDSPADPVTPGTGTRVPGYPGSVGPSGGHGPPMYPDTAAWPPWPAHARCMCRLGTDFCCPGTMARGPGKRDFGGIPSWAVRRRVLRIGPGPGKTWETQLKVLPLQYNPG